MKEDFRVHFFERYCSCKCLGMLSKDNWDILMMECILQAVLAILIPPEPSDSMGHTTLNNYCQANYLHNSLPKEVQGNVQEFMT